MSIQGQKTYGLLIHEGSQRYEEMCATLYTRSCELSEIARAVELARSSYESGEKHCQEHASKQTHRKQLTDWTKRASTVASGVMEVARVVHRQMLDVLTTLDRFPLGPVAYQGLSDLGYDVEPIHDAEAALQTSVSILRAYERQLGVCMTRFESDWLSVTASFDKSWSIFPSETSSSSWWLRATPFQWRDLLCEPPFQLRNTPDLFDEQSLGAIYSQQKQELQIATTTLLAEKPYPRKGESRLSNASTMSHTQDLAVYHFTESHNPPAAEREETALSALWMDARITALNWAYEESHHLCSNAQNVSSEGEKQTTGLARNLKDFQKTISARDNRRYLSGNTDAEFFSEQAATAALKALDAQLRTAHTVYQQFDTQIRNIQHYRQSFLLDYNAARPALLLKYYEETLSRCNVPMQALEKFRQLITLSEELIQNLDPLYTSLIKTQTTLASMLQTTAYARQKSEGKTGWLDYFSWNYDYLKDVLNHPTEGSATT